MQPLTLKTAIATYGHTRALKDGSVKPQNITFDHVEVSPIIAAFRRMVRNLEFDVSEMAISTYLCARANNKPFTAIPVFPLRAFHHGAILVNTKARVIEPKDLMGKKVGVRAYTVTGGLWVRGILQNEYGVDPNKITWVVVDEEHVTEFQLPKNVEKAPEGKDLKDMLIAGELAGAIGIGAVDHPDVKPLIPNAREAAVQYFRKTGVYPINHTVVIKNSVLDSHPWVAPTLFEAFARAKRDYLNYLNGPNVSPDDQAALQLKQTIGDPVPYGLEANRAALNTVIRFNMDQGIIPRRYEPEEIFARDTLGLE